MRNDIQKLIDLADPVVHQRRIRILETMLKCGNKPAVARELNMNQRNVDRAEQSARAYAARKGYSPENDMNHVAPNSHYVKGTSTLYKEDGTIGIQWVKTDIDTQRVEALSEVLETFSVRPAPKVKAPKKVKQELLSLYTLTDYHLGMYAWSAECGEEWDTEIASATFLHAIEQMMLGTPDSELAILNIQGDYLHWDGLDAVTPMNRHLLDADTRFGKLAELSLDVIMWTIEKLLTKHKRVRLLVCEGNHDLASSVWVRKSMKKIYAKNDRLDVDDTEFPFYAYLHGRTMLGFHHGHKMGNNKLAGLFSSEPRYRDMWGRAKNCYIHTGHYHHAEKIQDEFGGAVVERHPTLSSRDAYAARGGYVARRAAHVITYNATGDEVCRATVTPPTMEAADRG